ncbi:MAG TPA: phosphoribosylformylglycinamidine cyclo-ligase [Polyangiaceae bacterium]|jgi:phosphoribosylformylglycinamidine cyclo-ligase|nr:phosphoribosylformylglycinamidine cyclo-ligase [Polyangiaceae bacterium]
MAITYREAGVDIDAGDALVERIKPLALATQIPEVVDSVGGFAGLCALPAGIEEPLLVSGTDGVGTKLKIAFETGRHGTIGQDLVAMCVNDVLTIGAKPLFFLDYFASSKLDVEVAAQVIAGIADGCKLAGCALLGGETAELPGMYAEGEYDLAGFCVGVVSKKAVLGSARAKVGDALIAVASSGLHSNGYSLARRVLQQEMKLKLDSQVAELGESLADALLRPTRIYAAAVASLLKALGPSLHALCHVTGGGIEGNLPRVLPSGVNARFQLNYERPALFHLIAKGGPVSEEEMRRTFNLGVGLIAVVSPDAIDKALSALHGSGERAWVAGEVIPGTAGGEATVTLL